MRALTQQYSEALCLIRPWSCALDEPSTTDPKLSDVGEKLVLIPVPRSGISCGLEVSLSFTTKVASAAPLAAGLNVTPMMHFLPAAIVPVQLLLATENVVFVVLTLLNVTEAVESFVNVIVRALLVVPTV